MSESTEVAVAQSAELEAVEREQAGAFATATSLQTPILKVGQALTREVQDGNAEPGEFINTLTGEGLGDKIEFIIAHYAVGRSATDPKTKQYFVAFGDTIPEGWEDHSEYGKAVGTPFKEHPDAEEVYKQRANREEIPWGSGPPITTLHAYTGLVVISAFEDSDEEDTLQPVRLSLKRTDMGAVRKINSLVTSSLKGNPRAKVFDLSTYKKSFNAGPAYLVAARLGRRTTPEELIAAQKLLEAAAGGRTVSNEEQAETMAQTVEPDANGGLDV